LNDPANRQNNKGKSINSLAEVIITRRQYRFVAHEFTAAIHFLAHLLVYQPTHCGSCIFAGKGLTPCNFLDR